MKKILLALLLSTAIISSHSVINPTYQIHGSIIGLRNNVKVKLFSWSRDAIIDSAYAANGQFLLKGHLIEIPELLSLQIELEGKLLERKLLIGNESIEIKGNINSPEEFAITGSKFQPDQTNLDQINQFYTHQMDSLRKDDYNRNKAEIFRIRDLSDLKTIEFIKNNLNSYASLIQLSNYKSYIPKDTLQLYFNILSSEFKSSKYGKMIEGYINQINIGDKSPDFEAMDQKGKVLKLSELYKQKPVLLLFEAAWCAPCLKSIPELKDIYMSYKNEIEIVSLSLDLQRSLWLSSVKREDIPWISLWGGKGNFSEAYLNYGFTSIPAYVLIDTTGKIIDKGMGYTENSYQYSKIINLLKKD